MENLATVAGDNPLNTVTSTVSADYDQRVTVATQITEIEISRKVSPLQRELLAAESLSGRMLSFLRLERPATSIQQELKAVESALDSIRGEDRPTLTVLNQQRELAGLERIGEEELYTDRYAPSAQILTGVDSVSSSIELLNRADLNLGATVTSRIEDFCFSYDEEQMKLEVSHLSQMSPTISGNPFSQKFSSELKKELSTPQHMRILGVHERIDGAVESPEEQVERMHENLLQLAKDTVLMNFPSAREHFHSGGSAEEIASDPGLRVTLDFRTSPDAIQKHGGGAIPHVDTGNGARAAVLLYQSGHEEPLGTRLVADAGISPSLEIAALEKYGVNEATAYLSQDEAAKFLNPSIPMQEVELARWFGPQIQEHIIKSGQGEVAFFHQANAKSGTPGFAAERRKEAPLHYGVALPRQERDPSDPRIGVTRVSVFIAVEERVPNRAAEN
jgi:hypothetical protein